jgi:hypothetical protein
MVELFPVPGGPYSRYPRRCGMPAVVYQSSVAINSRASATSDWITPSCRMMLLSGRRCLSFALDHAAPCCA